MHVCCFTRNGVLHCICTELLHSILFTCLFNWLHFRGCRLHSALGKSDRAKARWVKQPSPSTVRSFLLIKKGLRFVIKCVSLQLLGTVKIKNVNQQRLSKANFGRDHTFFSYQLFTNVFVSGSSGSHRRPLQSLLLLLSAKLS